jgi:hypothetical protein
MSLSRTDFETSFAQENARKDQNNEAIHPAKRGIRLGTPPLECACTTVHLAVFEPEVVRGGGAMSFNLRCVGYRSTVKDSDAHYRTPSPATAATRILGP